MSMILKLVWMRINIRNYKYDSNLLIVLNTHWWSLAFIAEEEKVAWKVTKCGTGALLRKC